MNGHRHLREVLAINRAIACADDYDEVVRLVVERTATVAGATACMLILAAADGLGRVVSSVGLDPGQAGQVVVPLTEQLDRVLCPLLGCRSPERLVGVPVIGKAGLLGILALYWKGARPPEDAEDEELLSALADQAAIALDNAERVRQLRASEAKLSGIIAIAADAIVSVDQAQRVVMFNGGAEKLFGWSPGEILGKPLELLLPVRFRARHREHLDRFGAGPDTARKIELGQPSMFGLRKNGEEFPVDASISRLHDGAGWISTIVLRDITEQLRLAREEHYLAEVGRVLSGTLDAQDTLTNIAQLAMRENVDLCAIEFVDERGKLARLAVVGSDPTKGEVYDALKRFPLDRDRPHLSWAVLQSKEPQLVPQVSPQLLATLGQDEEQRLWETLAPTSLMGVPLIVGGQLRGSLVVASTRPGLTYRAADLRLLTMFGERAAHALENSRHYRTAQQAVQTRDEVLGIVAHDLRNPLSAILLHAAVIRIPAGTLTPRAVGAVVMIEHAVRRMDRLIQDLLDVKRMESGTTLPIQPESTPAAMLLEDCEESQRTLAASGGLELLFEFAPGLPEIWADRDRLRQVLENLLGNAIKFTPAGGRITVGARPGEGEVVFWVADTGPGVGTAELHRVFERFWQAPANKRRGVGLGLPIAKAIVTAHGGRIWVDSAPGQGSTFQFTVPLAPRP